MVSPFAALECSREEDQSRVADEEDGHRAHVVEDVDRLKTEVSEIPRQGSSRLEAQNRVDVLSKALVELEGSNLVNASEEVLAVCRQRDVDERQKNDNLLSVDRTEEMVKRASQE